MRGVFDAGCFPTGRHYPGIAHLLRLVAAGLAEEWHGDTTLNDLTLVCIDTETTGRDFATDRIVEIACVVWRGGNVVSRKHWLCNPGRSIPEEASAVHGIKDEDVRDKPSFAEVAEDVLEALAGAVPVAYNAEFDRAFLIAELSRAGRLSSASPPACRKGVDWVDPLTWAREIHKAEKSKSLGEVCGRLGIEIGQAHRATDDAEATLRVLAAFATDSRVPDGYSAFVQEQRRLTRLQDEERSLRWRS
jgi:DNA polymerase-3 subunit epsilon